MIRQRIRTRGVVAVVLAVAAGVAPSATAMPLGGDGRGLAFPAYHPATAVIRPNPDQQAPDSSARRVAPYTPAYYLTVRSNPDQQVPATHATPSTAAPSVVSTKEPGTATGSSFDWAALVIGIGAGGLLGLTIGAFTSATGRTRLRRQQAAVSG